ncbi:D-aminoacyl-tRNA deacylase [Halarchaeum rubridurum]|uniref:D-aminoacyl-tRNA deacylase n=1 Tax=Halarchaeum rubridurum TaxID=489911 RepID=A0A830FZQ2_9EURY|nr:D-aminoacyl-tRNA deacylase [Halarchaeum rubridurum]MBP1955204.1 D-aminoacyl-tRNA deacylase [Halarchaeum rubridurum]GGM68173.1 D-tyrosyl-tRNA(Tyr) deacylase [Halarchaeum rubridurum]
MTVGIIVSRADSASVRIGEQLRERADWERAGTGADGASEEAANAEAAEGEETNTESAASADDVPAPVARYVREGFELLAFEPWHLELDGVAAAFDDPDVVVFASRHAGETGPLLTAHFTGNFGAAEHGGSDRALAPACPNAHRAVVRALAEHAPEGYDVGMECTHHGPTEVGAPSMFVELGSSEAEWGDDAGAAAVADAILDLEGVAPETERTVAAFGGGHYVPRPTRIVEETDWAVGHVAAEWCLDDLGDPREHRDVVERVFAASGATRAVVDGEKPRLRDVIDDLGYGVVSETWLRETTGVALDVVAALEGELTGVDEGLRFGDPAREAGADGAEPATDALIVDHPDDLWADAHSVDPDAALAAAREHALAYTTEENGNRVAGDIAFPDADAYDAYVDALVGLLREKYDEVGRDDGTVRITDTAFDPAAAAERGVPEGPKFGRLADGAAVEVDGETVTPADVARERTETYGLSNPSEGKGN